LDFSSVIPWIQGGQVLINLQLFPQKYVYKDESKLKKGIEQ